MPPSKSVSACPRMTKCHSKMFSFSGNERRHNGDDMLDGGDNDSDGDNDNGGYDTGGGSGRDGGCGE